MNNRARERELQALLQEKASQENLRHVVELLNLRLERHKNALVTIGCDMIRGRAQELKNLLDFFIGDA